MPQTQSTYCNAPKEVYEQSNSIISSLFLPLIQLFKYYVYHCQPGYRTLNPICSIENFLSCWVRSVLKKEKDTTINNPFFLHAWHKTVVKIWDYVYQLCVCVHVCVCMFLSVHLSQSLMLKAVLLFHGPYTCEKTDCSICTAIKLYCSSRLQKCLMLEVLNLFCQIDTDLWASLKCDKNGKCILSAIFMPISHAA